MGVFYNPVYNHQVWHYMLKVKHKPKLVKIHYHCGRKVGHSFENKNLTPHFRLTYSVWKHVGSVWGSPFVSIVSRSKLSISTLSKSKSQQLRKSQHFQNLFLDGHGISNEIFWFCLDINVETKKYRSRSSFIHIYQNSWFFLDQEITWIFIYLDWEIFFNCRNLWKVVREAQGKLRKIKLKPSLTTFHRFLKSKISW